MIGSFSCSLVYINIAKNRQILAKQADIRQTKLSGNIIPEDSRAFSWSKLWNLLKKYWMQFCFGIGCAMASAYFNVQIPISLGGITSVLGDILKQDRSLEYEEYWNLIKIPCLRFCSMVFAQSVSSALTIASISAVGENMAFDLRTRLFRAYQSKYNSVNIIAGPLPV